MLHQQLIQKRKHQNDLLVMKKKLNLSQNQKLLLLQPLLLYQQNVLIENDQIQKHRLFLHLKQQVQLNQLLNDQKQLKLNNLLEFHHLNNLRHEIVRKRQFQRHLQKQLKDPRYQKK